MSTNVLDDESIVARLSVVSNHKEENIMFFKRIVAFVCAVVLVLSVTGCGVKQTDNRSAATGDYSKHMKFTINVHNAEKKPNAAYQELCEKFNVEFEFIPTMMSDWNEKVRIWMATGDMPDILYANIQNYNFSEYVSWAESGMLKEFPDMSKYPNLYKYKSALKSDPYFQIDGKTYAWVAPRIADKTENLSAYGFMYRKDWAEKLGMYKDEYTWEEFLALGKAFVEKNPGGNGAGQTIGIAGDATPFPHFAGLMQMSTYWDQYYLRDGKYVWGMDQPETLEGIKMLKRMYDEGILWKDQLMAKGKDGVNRFQAGQVGIVFDTWSPKNVSAVRTAMKESFPELDVDNDVVPMKVLAPNGKPWGQRTTDYWTISCLNPSLSDEEVDRILAIYDYLISDEVLIDQMYGLEGKDFTRDENGKAVLPDDFSEKRNHLYYVTSTYSDSYFTSDQYSQADKDASMEFVNMLKRPDAQVREYDYDLYFFTGEKKNKYGLFYEEGKTKILQLIMSGGDIEKEWEKWKASVRDDVNLVLDELNKNLIK